MSAISAAPTRFASAPKFLRERQPDVPVVCERPHLAARCAQRFLDAFPGEVLYAVKANPSPSIVSALFDVGIRSFDVSSLVETRLVRSLCPDARVFFMHPVKHPEHIRRAYRDEGVRDFALDSLDELDKIRAATGGADDLHLHVRVAVNNRTSRLPLATKYGVAPSQASELLIAVRVSARSLGVCFHVGSQAMQPARYAEAIARANRLIRRAGVILDSLDVGGGFPVAYPGMPAAPLDDYFTAIREAHETSPTGQNRVLLCEPGRAIAASSASLLVNITLRKDGQLYVNDGAYGGLFDAAHLKFRYPCRLIRDGEVVASEPCAPFRLYGPTCDSIDVMPGPFLLPADARRGDYIEIGQLGAYSDSLRTNFNGYGARDVIQVDDDPWPINEQESSGWELQGEQ